MKKSWILIAFTCLSLVGFSQTRPHAKNINVYDNMTPRFSGSNLQELLKSINDNFMFDFTGVSGGATLRYDAALGLFVPSTSSAQSHPFWSNVHTDINYLGNPRVGDSIYWDGEKWNSGEFGGWSFDVDYIPITGYTATPTQALTRSFGANVNTTMTFQVNGFAGDGLVHKDIRGVYVRFELQANSGGYGYVYVTMPDGSEKLAAASGAAGVQTANIFNIPINPGQKTFNIRVQSTSVNRVVYEVLGASQSRKINISPEVEFVQFLGSVNMNVIPQAGYITESNVVASATTPQIWYSEKPTEMSDTWSHILPYTVPDGVTKTVIKSMHSHIGGGSEEDEIRLTIVIDWTKGTITGNLFSDTQQYQSGYLYSDNLVGLKEIVDNKSHIRCYMAIEIEGRTITKLPWTKWANSAMFYGSYIIENYKTLTWDPQTAVVSVYGADVTYAKIDSGEVIRGTGTLKNLKRLYYSSPSSTGTYTGSVTYAVNQFSGDAALVNWLTA